MKKLLMALVLIELVGVSSSFADLLTKIEKNGEASQQIKVKNETKKKLYIAVYTVDNNWKAADDINKEAHIFSNLYSIEPNKHEMIDRPEAQSNVNRNVYFTADLNTQGNPDLPFALTPSHPARANRLNVGEGFGKVFGKGQDEFIITQEMLKNISNVPVQKAIKNKFTFRSSFPAKKDDVSSNKEIIYYGFYKKLNDPKSQVGLLHLINPDASDSIEIELFPNEYGFVYFDMNPANLNSGKFINTPIQLEKETENSFVIYPGILADENNIHSTFEPNLFGKKLRGMAKQAYDTHVKDNLE